jgi:hypothetical protein
LERPLKYQEIMNAKRRKAFTVVSLLLLTLCLTGCGSTKPKPVAWNVSVTKRTQSSIVVDLIGVSDRAKGVWEGYDLDQYWRAGDQRRQDANALSQDLVFQEAWVVGRKDPKWREWLGRGATDLLIIANLPGTNFGSGASDPRRLFVPLDKKAWKAKDWKLEIEVQDTLINVLNKPRK